MDRMASPSKTVEGTNWSSSARTDGDGEAVSSRGMEGRGGRLMAALGLIWEQLSFGAALERRRMALH